ncbi:hypothetical protein ACFYY2_07340 [Streptomyces sp. NPDC001822]|uniref:hypothetical protein n=1 Tax=Streptomyces sp. NPDC001822 TaxID=3364614 RepID=UPI00368DEEF8
MSGNRKRVLALIVGGLTSIVVCLGWGVVLRLLGDPVIDCVKFGAMAGGGTFGAAVAVTALFPFKDDPATGGQAPPPSFGTGAPAA